MTTIVRVRPVYVRQLLKIFKKQINEIRKKWKREGEEKEKEKVRDRLITKAEKKVLLANGKRGSTAEWEKDVSIPGTEVAKASIPRGAAGGKKVNCLFGGPSLRQIGWPGTCDVQN